jgi:hypothetical protein
MFSDHGSSQVTKTTESETIGKGGLTVQRTKTTTIVKTLTLVTSFSCGKALRWAVAGRDCSQNLSSLIS